MLPRRLYAALSPVGHSHVNVEAKGPYELQQGFTHRHSHLEVSTGTTGEGGCYVHLQHLYQRQDPTASGLASKWGCMYASWSFAQTARRGPKAGEDVF